MMAISYDAENRCNDAIRWADYDKRPFFIQDLISLYPSFVTYRIIELYKIRLRIINGIKLEDDIEKVRESLENAFFEPTSYYCGFPVHGIYAKASINWDAGEFIITKNKNSKKYMFDRSSLEKLIGSAGLFLSSNTAYKNYAFDIHFKSKYSNNVIDAYDKLYGIFIN